MRSMRIVALVTVVCCDGTSQPRVAAASCRSCLGRLAVADLVDLGKPFPADKDTICLFHLNDVADGEVKDAVAGGAAGTVQEPMTAEGKSGEALSCDGDKGWADVTDLAKIDGATGVLSGIPDAAGSVEVAVTATIDREVRELDEKALVWGREKVLSTTTQHVGTATQEFVIEVR